jgi:hypothetical protein
LESAASAFAASRHADQLVPVFESQRHVDHERDYLGGALRLDLALDPLEPYQPADGLVAGRRKVELEGAYNECARDLSGRRARSSKRSESLRESPIESGGCSRDVTECALDCSLQGSRNSVNPSS